MTTSTAPIKWGVPGSSLDKFLEGDSLETRRKARDALSKVKFEGNILISGCGAVTLCCYTLFPYYFEPVWKNITIIDRVDKADHPVVVDLIKKGGKFVLEDLTPKNFGDILSKYLKPGDLWLDLTVESGTLDFVRWAKGAQVMYVNAAYENWPETLEGPADLTELGLYADWMQMLDLLKELEPNDGYTAIVGCGANPGLVYHFAKQGLEDIAHAVLKKTPADEARNAKISEALKAENWAVLAQTLGVKVIHVSEKDSQITKEPRRQNEFLNTWSCWGMYDESILPAELAWGTHEKTLPDKVILHKKGPKHLISIGTMGMNTLVRSWTPDGEIKGRILPHEENFHLGMYFEIRDEKGEVTYRPTINYAYSCSESANASLEEVRNNNYKMQDHIRVMGDDIISGRDCLGVLIMGHDFEAWWIGSMLDIHEARTLAGPGLNATTLQVGAGVMGAIAWAVQNPKKGIISCYHVPHQELLPLAKPFLGPFASRAVDWNPLKGIAEESKTLYIQKPSYKATEEDKWQFHTFLSHNY